MKQLITAFFLLIFVSNNFAQNQEEWDDYFMPGAGYKMFVPKDRSALGTYHGFTTEFVIYARAKSRESRWGGPGRIKTYGNLSIMGSDNSEANDIFFVNTGLNLSFESKMDRKVFIPYFGIELGGLFQRDFSSMHFTPTAGVQLISTKRIIWSVQGGYLYTTKRFDEYSGYSYSSTLNILLWNE